MAGISAKPNSHPEWYFSSAKPSIAVRTLLRAPFRKFGQQMDRQSEPAQAASRKAPTG